MARLMSAGSGYGLCVMSGFSQFGVRCVCVPGCVPFILLGVCCRLAGETAAFWLACQMLRTCVWLFVASADAPRRRVTSG